MTEQACAYLQELDHEAALDLILPIFSYAACRPAHFVSIAADFSLVK